MERIINIKRRDKVERNNNISGLSQISNHWLFKIVAISLSGFFVFSACNSVRNTVQKKEILNIAQQEVQDLRVANLHLSISIKDMSSDRYLEKEARDRLNFGGKNETVFILPENILNLAVEEIEVILNPPVKSVYERGYNIDDWFEFFVFGI
jgi:cell division protein FtsB